MNIEDMTMEQIVTRLAELDEQVRSATDIEAVNKAAQEKTDLLTRKAVDDDLNSASRLHWIYRAVLLDPKYLK